MNVNSDEAAVLGAALHGASLTRQFRTKNIKLSDIAPYDIQVSYLAETKHTDAPGAPRTITSTAFARGSRTGTRKTVTFRRKNDFSLAFSYKEPPAGDFPVDLLDARISGVAEALANITEAGGIDPVIKATILFSESGFMSVPEAVAYAELKDDSITGTSCLFTFPARCCFAHIYARVHRKVQGIIWRIVGGRWINFDRGRVFVFVICLSQGDQSRGHPKRHHYPSERER